MARKKINLAAAAGTASAADAFVSGAPDAKPEKPALKLLTIQIEEEQHKRLKAAAVSRGVPMRELVLAAIERELSHDDDA